MCGLAGIFDSRDRRPIDRDLLTAMTDRLSHRGPDGAGFYVAEGIGLGHRRLSIIDLAGGHQPLFNEDHSVMVVYNGEIYNFRELASQLRALGHQFRTVCDTEVVVHAWEQWGPDCVKRFRGMFAFALWDSNSKTLFLARDRLGIKPLYYAELSDGRVIFGSEMKALLCDPALERRFDTQAIEDYFAFGYVPDPKSIYASVRKLPPAHTLVWKRGAPTPRPQQYWEIEFHANSRLSEENACNELRERMSEAVRMHLVSDVPLGAFLSGGVDSSSVVSMMAEHSSTPVNTCSIGFDVSGFDEAQYAELVAKHLKTDHHTRQVTANSFELIEDISGFYDEPFADSSAMPTYQVCRLAREKVTVALSGDGGDEAFAGYRRYRWHHYEELVRGALPRQVRQPVFSLLGQIYPKLDWAPRPLRAKSTLQALARDSVEGYFHSVSILGDRLRRRLYSKRMLQDLQGYHPRNILEKVINDAPVEHHLDRVQYADMKTYLPGDILTKVDRASMATSLEVRVPLLDHELLEWVATLPPAFRLRGREGKYLLKKAMEGGLPREILYRDKMGFSVPLANWFRGPLRESARRRLTEGELDHCGLFDVNFIRRLLDDHCSGVSDHSAAIWALLMFESFLSNVHLKNSAGAAPRRETVDRRKWLDQGTSLSA
jgi:asparagine synthase (glutamine-hydrolysing)